MDWLWINLQATPWPVCTKIWRHFAKNLRRRIKGAKYDEFRKKYLVSYLQIPFTFDLEIWDDLGDLGNFAENNSVCGDNVKRGNDLMTNDNAKNGDDFQKIFSENVKTQGKSPLSRLMIWDHLQKKAVTCMSVNFKDEAIAYVLEHLGVIESKLTDASLKSLEKKVKTFHGDLRARMKKMPGKYQDYRDRVGKNYLSKPFTFDLETCDDLDNFSKSSSDNDKCRNYQMINDHHRNSVDFEDMSSGNEKLGV
jgi:hypothetical protein